jgi:uncharacterized protein YqfA (UPF0365 family)
MESLYLIGIGVLALLAFVLAIVLFNFFGLWLRARIANAPVSLGKMVGMRLRKVPLVRPSSKRSERASIQKSLMRQIPRRAVQRSMASPRTASE